MVAMTYAISKHTYIVYFQSSLFFFNAKYKSSIKNYCSDYSAYDYQWAIPKILSLLERSLYHGVLFFYALWAHAYKSNLLEILCVSTSLPKCEGSGKHRWDVDKYRVIMVLMKTKKNGNTVSSCKQNALWWNCTVALELRL